ncbi:RNA polymerase sigma factor [Bacteroides sp.]
MAKNIKLKPVKYADAVYVEGVYKHDPMLERALYNHCKQYFDENYRGVFFVDDSYKMEIFQESFIKLWEIIESKKIYAEDGVLKGKDRKPFTSSLTTYFMGIARLKYLEWTRGNIRVYNPEDIEKSVNASGTKDDDLYTDMLYDRSDNIMLDIVADCIAHMSERCSQVLTMFYYQEKNLDAILMELQNVYTSKDALKTEKYKCMEKLRKSATEIYNRYLNE